MNRKAIGVDDYLEKIGCPFTTPYEKTNFCIESSGREERLFRILAKWNEFPKNEFGLMRKLIQAGKDWKKLFEGEAGEKLKQELALGDKNSINQLPEVSARIEADVKQRVEDIPLPGKSAIFKCIENDFLTLNVKDEVLRMKSPSLTFQCDSRVSNCFFEKVILISYSFSGSIALQINFKRNTPGAKEYFEKIGFELEDSQWNNCYLYATGEKMRRLFIILSKWNDIPDKEYKLMRALIESNNWMQLVKSEGWEKFKQELQLLDQNQEKELPEGFNNKDLIARPSLFKKM